MGGKRSLSSGLASVWWLGVACAACLSPGPSEPSAPEPPAAPNAAESAPTGPTATLEGPISLVDGKPAPNGIAFQVAPGCRVVRTSSDYLTTTDTVSVRGYITPVDIVLETQAGHRYVVEQKPLAQTTGQSQVEISAREYDPAGRETRRFLPVQSASELDDCRRRQR